MTDKATDVTVTQADEKRADDWATMLGRMGGVILDQSQRRGLAAQFAAHRIESTRTVPSGDDKHPEIGPGLPPLSSGEGRSNGAGEVDPSKMSVEMADLFGLVCKLNRLKTERDDLMRTDGGFSVIERAADMMDEIVDAVPELQSAFGKVCERERQLLAALSAPQVEVERLREALVAEREENLWNAYNTGHVRDGKWDHLCMSDGEWLARECGFNVSDCRFDDEAIRAAIPKAARKALAHKDVNANIGGTDA
ncbi:hypothetical protein [Sphingopyxis sp. 113P3]|uniref:hypothetical protein n=1 Tax=Sphingopyxis sp. (strain 113P3) TaxID=292913 RepID=UPI0006AD4F25|nr:hypothetical protein [Sphingopyxis sp. 113P3]ALC11196.1 hypothetical protein LH20_04445 [Sphingopyxis sp. 113P3]